MMYAKKLLNLVIAFICVLVLVMYIATLLGTDFFSLYGTINLSPLAAYVARYAIFLARFYLLTGIVCSIYNMHILPHLVTMGILYLIVDVFITQNPIWLSYILPSVYWCVYLILTKPSVHKLKLPLLSFAIYILFVITMNWIKVNVISTSTSNDITLFQVLILSVDCLALLAILYMKGMITYVMAVGPRSTSKSLENIFPSDPTSPPKLPEDSAFYAELASYTRLERFVASAVWLGQQLLVWVGILVLCHFVNNRFLEALVITSGYVVFGLYIQYRYHNNWCTLISGIIFWISSQIIPSFVYTQLIPVLLTLFLIYGSFRVALHFDSKNDIEQKLSELQATVDNWNTFKLEKYCDFNLMKQVAERKGLTAKQIKILKLYYCDSASWAQINIALSPWSESSIRRQLKTAEERFNS